MSCVGTNSYAALAVFRERNPALHEDPTLRSIGSKDAVLVLEGATPPRIKTGLTNLLKLCAIVRMNEVEHGHRHQLAM